MLSVYDLYDLHAIFVRIRFSPENSINYDIMLKVVDVLTKERGNSNENQFRVALQSVNGLEKNELYDFIYIENKYSYYPMPPLKNEKTYVVLIACCEELIRVIAQKDIEQITELADCIHNLPIFIVENNFIIPKKFWKNEIQCYRKKWNKSFLSIEQRNIWR